MNGFSFTETAPHEAGFAKVFERELVPFLTEMEEKRKKAVQRNKNWLVFVGAIVVILSILGMEAIHPAIVIFPLVFGGAIMLVIYLDRGAKVGREVTKFVRPVLVDFMGDMSLVEGATKEYLPLDRLARLGLLPKAEKTRIDFGIKGAWRDTDYRLVKARLTETYNDHNDKRRTRTLFRGIVMEVDVPVEMPVTLFLPDFGETGNKIAGWLGRSVRPPEQLHFPNPEFEEAFEVFTEDRERAQEFLKPVFAETLMQISEETQGKRRYLAAAFLGDKFYLAMRLPHDFLNFDVAKEPLTECEGKIHAALDDLTLPRRVIDALLG